MDELIANVVGVGFHPDPQNVYYFMGEGGTSPLQNQINYLYKLQSTKFDNLW